MPAEKDFENREERAKREGTGEMTVREAGCLDGEKGGQKVKHLIEEGEEAENKKGGERAA